MSANLATILTETAEQTGDKTAFKLDDVELNYSMLNEGSARVAGLLKSNGLDPDMLDERARVLLEYVDPRDLVLILRKH